MKRALSPAETPQVGRSLPRLESWLKVTGRAEYVHNLRLPGMLYGRIFRSSVAHGRIRRLDVSAAQAVGGVHRVVSAADLKGIVPDPYYGPAFHDQPVLAVDKVRYVGEPVAVVLAADPHVAEEAAHLIVAEYEELPAVYDEVEAMTSKAIVHDTLKPAGTFPDLKHLKGRANTNVALDFHLLGAEAVLEHAIRRGERLRGVAAPQVEIERYIRVGSSFQMLQVGERPCRLERVVHDGTRGHRLDFVVDGGQLFVFGDDQVRRFFRHVRVGGEDHRDRLADVADFVHSEHRLVVERRAVIRIGHNFLQIGRGHHAMHAAHGLGSAHVEALDPAVRDAAAENPAVQHAGQAQVMDILSPPGNLQPGLEARQRAPDLRRFR